MLHFEMGNIFIFEKAIRGKLTQGLEDLGKAVIVPGCSVNVEHNKPHKLVGIFVEAVVGFGIASTTGFSSSRPMPQVALLI